MQIDPVKHLLLIVFVLKRNIFKINGSFHISQCYSIVCILDFRFNIHNFLKPFKSRIAILKLLGKVHQCPDWISKYPNIQQKRNQIIDRDHSLCNENPSGKDDIYLNQCCKNANPGLKTAHVMITVLLCSKKSVISMTKFFVFNRLIGKRFHHTDARQIILDLFINLGNFNAVLLKGPAHPLI